jgi:hypothetical protein
MNISHVKITGADDAQQKGILEDVLYIEGLFFQASFPVLTDRASDQPADESPKVSSQSTSNPSPTKKESEDKAEVSATSSDPATPEDASNEDEKTNKQFPNAQKIVLPHVGDSVTAKYAGSGNRFVRKSNGRAFVVYLENQAKEIEFIQGTQLSEALTEAEPKIGDVIKIEKTRQCKRAKEREHARAAIFKITLV